MAIVSVTEISEGRTGNADDELKREYRRMFRVVTDSPLDEQGTIIASPYLPKRYSTYVAPNGFVDRFAMASKIEAHQEIGENPYRWLVGVDYSTSIWDRLRKKGGDKQDGKDTQPENPLFDPTEISYDTVDGPELIFDVDLNNVPIVNSAGEPYNGRPVVDALIVLTISKAFADYNPNDAINFYNAVNIDTFFGFPKHTVKCKGLKGTSQFKNEFFYWKVTGVFHIWTRIMSLRIPGSAQTASLAGWQLEEAPCDKGFKILSGGKLVRALDDSGVPESHEVFLDGSGSRLGNLLTPCYRLTAAGVPIFTFHNRFIFATLGF